MVFNVKSGRITTVNEPLSTNILNTNTMKIESFAFLNEEEIPSRFTCDGENINPELTFKDVPKNAKSLAFIMDDPDIPQSVKEKYGINVWDHWVMWNIPPVTTEVDQGSEPVDAVVGLNSSGKNEYTGPCPPDREHRYLFKLYALDKILDLPQATKASDLVKAMQGHIIAEAELIGRYERK